MQGERLKLLKDKVSQARAALGAATASGDQGKIDAASKGVADTLAQVTDFQTKVVSGSTPQGGGGPPPNYKQAPDGKFYAPDPARPGKYLMWQSGG